MLRLLGRKRHGVAGNPCGLCLSDGDRCNSRRSLGASWLELPVLEESVFGDTIDLIEFGVFGGDGRVGFAFVFALVLFEVLASQASEFFLFLLGAGLDRDVAMRVALVNAEILLKDAVLGAVAKETAMDEATAALLVVFDAAERSTTHMVEASAILCNVLGLSIENNHVLFVDDFRLLQRLGFIFNDRRELLASEEVVVDSGKVLPEEVGEINGRLSGHFFCS